MVARRQILIRIEYLYYSISVALADSVEAAGIRPAVVASLFIVEY